MSNLRDEIASSTQSMRERCMGKGRGLSVGARTNEVAEAAQCAE